MPEVLLIDDKATQLRMRETALRDAGISVACARWAETALAFLRSLPAGI